MGEPSFEADHYDADIIILSLNRLNETLEAISSALRQKGVSLRVAVLDQGSSMENQQVLRENIRECAIARLFTEAENRGVGAGRNFISSTGHGRIIVGLDNDAVFLDDYVIHNALKMFDVNPKLGAIAFNIVDRDGGRGEYSSWGYPISLKSRAAERFLTTTFVGAGHAIRRETWDEVGGYDPKLFFTWEEYDFCLRAIAREWDIIYDGSLHVHHKLALDQRLQWSQGRQRLFVRNRLIIGRKWGASWLSLLPRITGYLITGSLKCCIRATLAGIFEAVSDDKNIAKQSMTQHMRRYLQANEQRYRGISRFMLRTDF